MDFAYSPRARQLISSVEAFLREEILPAEAEYRRQLHSSAGPWCQPPIMETLMAKAKAAGLWNLFLPDHEWGAGLSNVDYAPLAELSGRSFLAPEVFNCNAPDSGNMEVLAKYGSPQQQERWLKPLLAGEIRSAFCMTEPAVASSDATNMQARAIVDGDSIVCDGRKWWSSGLGHPHCRVLIYMALTDATASPYARHSMVLIPIDSAGVKIERMLPVFGAYDEPFGHGEVSFEGVRVPLDHVIAGPGRGFEIAQGRLGPGRIHHCMRVLGAAERALELMIARARSRHAFGKALIDLGGNRDIIAEARIALEQARLLTLKAAWMMDTVGAKAAMSEISQIKVEAPSVAQKIIDQAIQMHGGAGLSDDTPLAALYAYARVLRLADGPDEVHKALIAKLELRRHAEVSA